MPSCAMLNFSLLYLLPFSPLPSLPPLPSLLSPPVSLSSPLPSPFDIKVAPAMSNYRPNVAERPAPGQWYDHDIDYAENSETDLNVFFYGLSLKVPHLSTYCIFIFMRCFLTCRLQFIIL